MATPATNRSGPSIPRRSREAAVRGRTAFPQATSSRESQKSGDALSGAAAPSSSSRSSSSPTASGALRGSARRRMGILPPPRSQARERPVGQHAEVVPPDLGEHPPHAAPLAVHDVEAQHPQYVDRKSTRLNSSH